MQTATVSVKNQPVTVHIDVSVSQQPSVVKHSISGGGRLKQIKNVRYYRARYIQMIKIQGIIKDDIDCGYYKSDIVRDLYKLIEEETNRYTHKL
jgi:hypothetical protein